ncbi:MAG: hypothetical protein KDC92_08500 [Bacteroidetes bacterium]|nr:hypothetical protein [Bacteroidota bacterium]
MLLFLATYKLQNGLDDNNFNDSLITLWLKDSLGSDTIPPFLQATFQNDPVFISLLIDELEDTGNDTNAINQYTFNQIIGWDNNLAIDVLEEYANNNNHYDAIIDELIDHKRDDLVDALFNEGYEDQFLEYLLANDNNNDFLDCYTTGEIDDLWNNLVVPPTSSFDKADRISDLMTLVDPNELRTWLLDLMGLMSTTKGHLKNCAANGLLESALHYPTFTAESNVLGAVANYMSASDLASFFTTGTDPLSYRPFMLLKNGGNHAYILNVIQQNDPNNFIEKAVSADISVATTNNVLKNYLAFKTDDYINAISAYFGKSVAQRVFNALLGQFKYTRKLVAQEYNIYGSSRVGIKKDTSQLLCQKFEGAQIDSAGHFDLANSLITYERELEIDTTSTNRILAFKHYELSNHLGNVLATILDRRTIHDVDTGYVGGDSVFIALWDADIINAQDYYPFGMLLPNRVYQADSTGTGYYRYGFGNHERIDEVYSSGNAVDMGDRWLYTRLGRTTKTDAKAHLFTAISSYSYANNNPILFIDPDGKVVVAVNEDAKRNILNSLSPDDRKYIKFKKDGTLKVKRLTKAQSESDNYKALLTLAKSEVTYKFVVAESYPDMKNEGKPEPLVGDDVNGTRGVTLIPEAELDPSPDNDVWIYTSDKLSEKRQAENTAHEGYGHAYFYELLQQGEDVNPYHDYKVVEEKMIYVEEFEQEIPIMILGDTNEKLKNQIDKAEKEAGENYEKGKKQK